MREVIRLRRCCEERERAIVERNHLTFAEYGCLLALPRDESTDARQLCAELRLSPSRVSRILERLCAARLVARADHPGDRRVTLLTLTARGRRLRTQLEDALVACEALVHARLDAAERIRAREGLGLVLRALEPA
jgi:DNA-binding MarR family transcriptional regulator